MLYSLGKTIQVIGFLSGLFDAAKIKTVLIVAPVGVIVNWTNEFEKWQVGRFQFLIFNIYSTGSGTCKLHHSTTHMWPILSEEVVWSVCLLVGLSVCLSQS